jgi:hypothetical protein
MAWELLCFYFMKVLGFIILLFSNLCWGAATTAIVRSEFSFPKDSRGITKIDNRFWELCRQFGMDTNYCLLGENFIQGRVKKIYARSSNQGYEIFTAKNIRKASAVSVIDRQNAQSLTWLLRESVSSN